MELSQRTTFTFLMLVFVTKVYMCDLPESERFKCGYNIQTKEECWTKNCCYDESASSTTPKCYFRRKDAAGGSIQHSNGLCVYPQNGTTADQTLLVWSSNCFSRNAVFLVSVDYSTYHVASGKCIRPQNRSPSDPGDDGKLVLGSWNCNNAFVGFRKRKNGNLVYYTSASVDVCIGEGPSSTEPKEGDPVIVSKDACSGVSKCQHLTYVYQERFRGDQIESKSIDCPRKFLIRVTWANYGPLARKIPAQFQPEINSCTTNKTTNMMKVRCDGMQECLFQVDDFTLTGKSCTKLSQSYLEIRYTCEGNTKAAAPTGVAVVVLGQTKLKVTWSPGNSTGNIDWYSICWQTAKNETRCHINVTSPSKELNNLQPATMYYITVALHSCEGGIGNYSEAKIGITRTVALERPQKVSSVSFEVMLGRLQSDDKYVQIIVKKLDSKKRPSKSPDEYLPSNLKPYDVSTGNEPYIAAELNKMFVDQNPLFTIGNGERYRKGSKRPRRNSASGFKNAKLEPGSYYSVFQRTFKSDNLYYNSEWMDAVQTDVAPSTTGLNDRNSKDVPTSRNGGRPQPPGQEREGSGDDGGGGGSTAIIGAVVGAAVVLILVMVLTIVCYRRKRRARNKPYKEDKPVIYEATSSQDHIAGGNFNQGTPSPFMETGPELNNIHAPPGVVYAKPDKNGKKNLEAEENNMYANLKGSDNESSQIKASRFLFHVQDMKKNKNSGFEKEFQELPVGQLYPWDVSKKPVNADKNRYGNIVTYDHSRVILSGEEDRDYINASFIDGIKPDIYIASQGPTKKTVKDFWRMVWEQNSNSIISLTNIAELGRVKCFQYWPDDEATFGKIHIKTLKTELFADYIIRHLRMETNGETKEVKQYHFTSWPDHGVPKYPTQLLTFRRRFKALHTKGSQPIIVHCSAGVGRTGTFIALDLVLERLSRLGKQTIDIYDTVKNLRTRRVNMVQTLEQYIFVHDAVLESILCGVTEIEAENLETEFERLNQRELNKSFTGFEFEFKKLNSVCPPLAAEECETALKEENKHKNRDPDIYPADNFRVLLSRGSGGKKSSYINATYVDGYTQTRAYIATQTPLPDTINDFWRMVFEKKATVIVMLNNLEEGMMSYPQYWPQNLDKELEYGELLVKMVSTDTRGPIVSRKFTVTSTKQSSAVEHVVRHVQFTDWPESEAPSNDDDVMDFLETVEEAQQRSANGVLMVHCSNGAHRTGAYLALAIQRERIKTEHVIDVFRCIKMMRGQRPQFVGNVDQYKFCYYAMMKFVEDFQTYDNIPKTIRD